jgi:DNA-binding MarR family transcriptional regulator
MASAASPTELETLTAVEERAWRSLVRAHACLVKRLDAQLEAEHGLPLTSHEVLLRLSETPGGKMRMHDIASSVLLSRSGLTRLVDRLERDGLVDRCSCENDARGAYAVITDAGRAKLAEAGASHRAAVRSLFLAHYTEAELEQLGMLLGRLLPADGCCAET